VSFRISICFISCLLLTLLTVGSSQASGPSLEESAPQIRARIEASPILPFQGVPFAAQPLKPGWESGTVSGIAIDRNGTIYEIQRGEKAEPIVVLDRNGIVLRSWGKGILRSHTASASTT
jgi:hypothetical protein